MGYNNDQFYDIESAGEDVRKVGSSRFNGQYNTGANNPGFAYPDRTIRVVDPAKSKTVNTEGGLGGRRSFHESAPLESTLLKRGYIRSLETSFGGVAIPVAKCQFQFNPQFIQQSVQQTPSIRSYLQEDPSLYALPTPGSSNFAFTLMFDRSMEMNNSKNEFNSRIDPSNPWELSDPGQVGVLRDLAAFYASIGQGLSESQRGYQEAALIKNAEQDAAASQEGVESIAGAVGALPTFLDMNVGNTAFLAPLPVRVVFSSLYIVDGFVTNTDVRFTKFNSAMVPMQCVLNVTMEAKYIGFAKKKTFLTDSLDKQVQAYEADQAANAAVNAALVDSLASLRSVELQLFAGVLTYSESSAYPSELATGRISDVLDVYATSPDSTSTRFGLFGRFPGVAVPSGGSFVDADRPSTVRDLFVNGSASILARAEYAIHGPFPERVLRGVDSQEDLDSFVSRLIQGPVLSVETLGGPNGRASTSDEWSRTATAFLSEKGKEPSLNPSTWDSALYFVVEARVVVTGSSEGQSATARAEKYLKIADLNAYRGRITLPLDWGEESASEPSVPADNAATGPSTPGSTSDVGNTRRGGR